ncbi:MAG: FG-GAP-like repeat-containing protein [Promethearchaeota archaeon]
MNKQTKSKLILCIILIASALTGIIHNEFNVKYVEDNYNSNDNVVSNLRGASGNWETPITQAVGNEPFKLFLEDANNDGYNDIVTANYGSDNVSILLWNNTSSDWDPHITKYVGHPYSVFIGDANNDGYNDIVTVNFGSANVTILLWNYTSSDWDPPIMKIVGNGPNGIFIGDANNDGYYDIATSNYYSDDISILLWNSTSGDWDSQITKAVGDSPNSVFIEDANNDGYNDIAIANVISDDVTILLWNSTSGDWDSQITKAVGETPSSMFIEDANNDGYNDIATANYDFDDVSILLWNSTSGDWEPQITKSVGFSPRSIFIGDSDNDGYNDIVTANEGSDDVTILLWNSTSGDWDSQITKAVGNNPTGIFIGDANNDGYNDIVTANYGSDDVSIILWKLPYISIISPENKVYGPLKGYYPATYGFENDDNGDDPKGWTIEEESAGNIEIIGEIGGHKKVLEIPDDNYSESSIIFQSFENYHVNGTIEFWVLVENANQRITINVGDENAGNPWEHGCLIWFARDGKIQLYNGSDFIDVYSGLQSNVWYHLKIEFDCNDDWHLWLNGVQLDIGGYTLRGSPTSMTKLRFGSQSTPTPIAYFDAIGYSWDPAYDVGDNLNEGMRLSFYNNTPLDWIAYSLDGSANKTIFEQEIIPLPEDGPHSIQLFGRDAVSGEIIASEIRYFTVDTITPEIIINSPIDGDVFGYVAPKYNISIIETHLESVWYTIDGGITNFTINQLNGVIDKHAWIDAPLGPITIRFYVKDAANNTNYKEVLITKAKLLGIDIINQSFSSLEFTVEFFVYNESGEAIDFASIEMWWNEVDVSADVQNLGNGHYLISLEPITVVPGENPILLHITISATGYEEKHFETYIAVDPASLLKGEGEPTEEFPLILIIIISALSVGAIIGLASIFWLRKRKRELQ